MQNIRKPSQFEDLANSLKPHPTKAQILIEIRLNCTTLDKAMAVLKMSGITKIQHIRLRKGNPAYILLQFSDTDLKEPILNLTEAGFIQLIGMSPLKKKI